MIGTNAAGTGAIANGAHGVYIINGANANAIGGTAAGDGNTIAYNAGDGIFASSTAGVSNSFLRNLIYSNSDLGIDLGTNGVTANDPSVNMDSDTGANNLQNFPVITSAVTNGTQITIAGTINSTANSYFRIEFFANTANDGSGYGEGQRYLGFANVATDGSGNGTFNEVLTETVCCWRIHYRHGDQEQLGLLSVYRYVRIRDELCDSTRPQHSTAARVRY